ncbi:hypothetical protein ACFEMC_08835 [Kineococcus sp. DHX-1]|uniref:hypothetical protein n=1 Tax=Kineococcus sp. DHX-1 TaxID=3349638 RepID=UPI0036D37ED7
MRTPWLTAVLTRGGQVDAGLPWRAGPAESWEDELRHGQVRRVVGDVLVAGDVGVDAVADAPVRAQALALLLSPGVVLLGVAALWVHLGHPLAAPSRVQVAGSRSGTAVEVGGLTVVSSRARPAAGEVTTVGGLRVSIPARALLDAATAHPQRAGRWRSALTAAGLLDEDAVLHASGAARGRTGVRAARQALSLPRNAPPRPVSSSADATP